MILDNGGKVVVKLFFPSQTLLRSKIDLSTIVDGQNGGEHVIDPENSYC